MKKTFCKIVDKVGVKISDRDIESCQSKDSQQLMKFKKDLFKLNLTDIDLDDAKIFINQSLCPYYKILWSKSKRLLRFNCNGQGKTLGK